MTLRRMLDGNWLVSAQSHVRIGYETHRANFRFFKVPRLVHASPLCSPCWPRFLPILRRSLRTSRIRKTHKRTAIATAHYLLATAPRQRSPSLVWSTPELRLHGRDRCDGVCHIGLHSRHFPYCFRRRPSLTSIIWGCC